jgi:putative membrane protein
MLFYAVGIAGLIIPVTIPLFIRLFPFALLLSLIGLIVFHSHPFDTKTLLVFAGIFLLGLFVEVLGVNTGKIFGNYSYGNALGIKLYHTPLIIGLNWLMLVYLTASVFNRFSFSAPLKIVFASLSMVLYDFLLEPAAPRLEMWNWDENLVPVKNYIDWFLVAFVFHTLVKLFRVKTDNPLALTLFFCQLFFFGFISLNFLIQ